MMWLYEDINGTPCGAILFAVILAQRPAKLVRDRNNYIGVVQLHMTWQCTAVIRDPMRWLRKWRVR